MRTEWVPRWVPPNVARRRQRKRSQSKPLTETSYYARRAARDPDWHVAQLAGAAERARRRREADADALRRANALAARRCRQRQSESGYTFYELWQRVGGDRKTLAYVLRDEVRLGRVTFHSTMRRFELNGGMPADVRDSLHLL